MSAADDGGFLARWSRRKAGGGLAEAAEARAATVAGRRGEPPRRAAPGPRRRAARGPRARAWRRAGRRCRRWTTSRGLTHSSDYSRFVLPGVEADVRNAAMKKLFSDPHFNVMDGLDTYIDDYGKPDPIPPAMLRQMNQSIALGLFADEEATETTAPTGGALAQACADGGEPGAVAQSSPGEPLPVLPAESTRAPDDDPDLRLQQDDADRRGCADPGPRA